MTATLTPVEQAQEAHSEAMAHAGKRRAALLADLTMEWIAHGARVDDLRDPELREREIAAGDAGREVRRVETLHRLVRGCRVRVVKGRKIPKGAEGVVVWVGDSNFGERCGVVVDGTPPGPDGKVPAVFTSTDNVVVTAPSAAHAARVEQRLPRLDGTPKQIAWAERIRDAAIKANKVTLDAARERYDSRFWIDNRAKFAA